MRLWSYGMWSRVVWYIGSDVIEHPAASIFMTSQPTIITNKKLWNWFMLHGKLLPKQFTICYEYSLTIHRRNHKSRTLLTALEHFKFPLFIYIACTLMLSFPPTHSILCQMSNNQSCVLSYLLSVHRSDLAAGHRKGDARMAIFLPDVQQECVDVGFF
jgi:hypothetical protein